MDPIPTTTTPPDAQATGGPLNMGELPDADAVGTVGNSACGEMLRMWIKYRQEKGRRVIDKATFQSFGCETAIAVASLATELIKGKTAEEALQLKGEDLSGELGPLPPMKIHCAELVEGALRNALESPAGAVSVAAPQSAAGGEAVIAPLAATSASAPGLKEILESAGAQKPRRIVILEP